jgi:hypothetical protein
LFLDFVIESHLVGLLVEDKVQVADAVVHFLARDGPCCLQRKDDEARHELMLLMNAAAVLTYAEAGGCTVMYKNLLPQVQLATQDLMVTRKLSDEQSVRIPKEARARLIPL